MAAQGGLGRCVERWILKYGYIYTIVEYFGLVLVDQRIAYLGRMAWPWG